MRNFFKVGLVSSLEAATEKSRRPVGNFAGLLVKSAALDIPHAISGDVAILAAGDDWGDAREEKEAAECHIMHQVGQPQECASRCAGDSQRASAN